MKATNEILFVLSLLVSVLVAGLAYSHYRKTKDLAFNHLLEFWCSMMVMISATFFFQQQNPQVRGLAMVGWIWPLRCIRLLLEDLSGVKLMQKWEYILLSVGAFATLALASYNFSFTAFTLPFTLSICYVGASLIYQADQKIQQNLKTPLYYSMIFLFCLFFLERLAFPFLRFQSGWQGYGPVLDHLIVVGFAVTCLSGLLEKMGKGHDLELEELLRERNDKLLGQSKYSELGMMSAGIAHEINNPLAVIQARTTQLLRIYRNPDKVTEVGEGLEQILYTSERINRTIQGVREFVHQNEKGPETEIKLKDLIDDVLAFCGQRLKNHGVSLRFYGLENFSVKGHKIQLEQVVLNLINNSFDAIEYLPDKWIEISAHETSDKVQVYFKDSGNGIPPEIAKKMMEPFYSTKEIGKGTGLGLALAKGIVEKHGGSLVYLANAPHTTFLLELPRLTAEAEWGLPLVH